MIALNTSGDFLGTITWQGSHCSRLRNLAAVLPTLWSGGDIYVDYPTGGKAYVKPKFRNIGTFDIVLFNDCGWVDFVRVVDLPNDISVDDIHGIVVRIDP